MSIRARDVMSRSVVTVSPEATLREAIALLHERRISGVPVARDGVPVGVVSRTDVFAALDDALPAAGASVDGLACARLLARKVGEVMTPRIVSVAEEASLSDVAQAMVGERVHRVLVTRGGKLTGIVSAFDLATALSSMMRGLDEGAED